MATEGEVLIACDKANDNADFQDALDTLGAVEGGAGEYEIVIRRDGQLFSLDRLIEGLEADDATQATMIATIETAIATALGPDEITVGTIRKAIKDAKTTYEADIAAT